MLSYPPVPELFFGPVGLKTWGLFVGLGILAAGGLTVARGRRAGIPARTMWDLVFWVSVSGILGARVLYVMEYWRDFASVPWHVVAIWEGGMSAFGALILGTATGVWSTRRHRLPLSRVAAAAAPAALLGDAIGRLGGAASHMYPGTPTTFPLSYIRDGVQRHEVGVELALVSLVGFFTIVGFEWWFRRRGRVMLDVASRRRIPERWPAQLVLVWYATERLVLDFLRASDLPGSDIRYRGLTLAQWLALLGLACSFLWLVFASRERVDSAVS